MSKNQILDADTLGINYTDYTAKTNHEVSQRYLDADFAENAEIRLAWCTRQKAFLDVNICEAVLPSSTGTSLMFLF